MPRELKAEFKMISNPIPERMAALQIGMAKAVESVMQYNANDAQNFARANAPWTDRTGNARQGLFAKNFKRGKLSHTIVIWHSVPYGIWLELANDRKYKIIEPTWLRTGRNVMADLQKVMAAA